MSEGYKLMLVDDNQVNLDLLGRRLGHKGFEVVSVVSPFDVLSQAKEHKPDLIILDLYMPDKDGFQTATEVKSEPLTSSIPIIGYTAAILDSDFEKAKDSGCDDVCPKDGDIETLLSKVRNLLDAS